MTQTKAIAILLALSTFCEFAANAAASTWDETIQGGGDAGASIVTAQVPLGIGSLDSISGIAANDFDGDFYKIHLSDPGEFIATTVGGVDFDTLLFLFDASGHLWLGQDDDAFPGSNLAASSLFFAGALQVPPPGDFWLAISPFNLRLLDADGLDPFEHPGNISIGGLTSPVTGRADRIVWQNITWQLDHIQFLGYPSGPYVIRLTSAEFAAVPEPASTTSGLIACLLALPTRGRRCRNCND